MARMTGPDCAVMFNLINTHTHNHCQLYYNTNNSINLQYFSEVIIMYSFDVALLLEH